MSEFFEPKKMGHYKRRCHDLIREIWGGSKEGNAAAYLWLGRRYGTSFHFATLNDEKKLKEVYKELWYLSFNPPDNPELPIKLQRKLQKKLGTKEPKKKYNQVFSDKSVLREVGRRNTLNTLPWYKKILYLFAPQITKE